MFDDRPRVSPIVGLLFFVFLVAVAYFFSIVVYIVMFRLVALMPNNELLNDDSKSAVLYILLMGFLVLCMIPMFNKEMDATLRRFGLLSAIFLVLFVAGKDVGIFQLDPTGSLQAVIHQIVDPIVRLLPRRT